MIPPAKTSPVELCASRAADVTLTFDVEFCVVTSETFCTPVPFPESCVVLGASVIFRVSCVEFRLFSVLFVSSWVIFAVP